MRHGEAVKHEVSECHRLIKAACTRPPRTALLSESIETVSYHVVRYSAVLAVIPNVESAADQGPVFLASQTVAVCMPCSPDRVKADTNST